jgi:hypothetical protein
MAQLYRSDSDAPFLATKTRRELAPVFRLATALEEFRLES